MQLKINEKDRVITVGDLVKYDGIYCIVAYDETINGCGKYYLINIYDCFVVRNVYSLIELNTKCSLIAKRDKLILSIDEKGWEDVI